MQRFTTFVGVDLGGARGKTTAVASLSLGTDGAAIVDDVAWRHQGTPWTDDVLLSYLSDLAGASAVVIAINAPLTAPSCVRCALPACPSVEACTVPSVVWLRTRGAELAQAETNEAQQLAAQTPTGEAVPCALGSTSAKHSALTPYTHRCTEVWMHYQADLLDRAVIGQLNGPLSARGSYLRRALSARGFAYNDNLIEVAPRATVTALFGEDKARGYKRDADPWITRAAIVEGLGRELRFGPKSRLAREEVLGNDHCFDAVLCAYTAFLYSRNQCEGPHDDAFIDDGWIWAPSKRLLAPRSGR